MKGWTALLVGVAIGAAAAFWGVTPGKLRGGSAGGDGTVPPTDQMKKAGWS